MKTKSKIPVLFILMMLLSSCEKYETTVTNVVNKDGSVLRQVIMKNNSNDEFEPDKFKVPVDSSWTITRDMEINEDNDTIWTLRAEKLFPGIDEINMAYLSDSGANKNLVRSVSFSKKFRWFTTVFSFSEKIEKVFIIDCPVSEFLSPDELAFFQLPYSVQTTLEQGADSVSTKELKASVEKNTEAWYLTALARQGLILFYEEMEKDSSVNVTKEEIMSKEAALVKMINDDTNEDSLLLMAFGEEFTSLHKAKFDTALSKLEDIWEVSFNSQKYDVKTIMPGKLIYTNGYLNPADSTDTSREVLWSVGEEHFLTEDYIMTAESRINNYYLWGITLVFIIFVFTGLLISAGRKKNKK